MAKEKGYSEPDPRIDLSGMDVIRKLVILSREAGYRVEQEDVEKHLFVPDSYFKGSIDDFWKNCQSWMLTSRPSAKLSTWSTNDGDSLPPSMVERQALACRL